MNDFWILSFVAVSSIEPTTECTQESVTCRTLHLLLTVVRNERSDNGDDYQAEDFRSKINRIKLFAQT
jgi:hypothetical protein